MNPKGQGMAARTRYKYTDHGTGRWWNSNHNLPAPPDVLYPHTVNEVEYLHNSQGNPVHLLGKKSGRIGGNFMAESRLCRSAPTEQIYAATINQPSSAWKRYRGVLSAVGPVGVNSYPSAIYSSSQDLDAFGTTAIANVIPTNPISGLSVFLGELKNEGIPSLPLIGSWKRRTGLAKSAGSEYLNKEFGWDPLIGDIRSFWRTAHNSEELIKQYAANSGRKMHRSFTAPTERTVVAHTDNIGYTHNMYPLMDSTWLTGPPRRETTEIIEKTRWFEGCFTYYLPPLDPSGGNGRRNRQIAKKLYGVGITPEVVWDLTPWSWAADWVGNFGDVLHNVGAFRDDGLVMHYGYVMETIVHRLEITVSRHTTKSQPTIKRSSSAILSTTTKVRRIATPYGFGLDSLLFSNRQLSILSALGISRS